MLHYQGTIVFEELRQEFYCDNKEIIKLKDTSKGFIHFIVEIDGQGTNPYWEFLIYNSPDIP